MLTTSERRRFDDFGHGNGVQWRLADAARGGLVGRVGGQLMARPTVRPREVTGRRRVEHYVGHHARTPLPGEERIEVVPCPLEVEGGQADRDEGGVPAPLVRVEVRGRLYPTGVGIEAEDICSARDHDSGLVDDAWRRR